MRGLLAANLRRFKLITFDVTDTLLSFSKPPAVEYNEAVRRLGFPAVCEVRLAAEFRTHFKQMASEFPNFGRGSAGQQPHHLQLTWENWWRCLIVRVLTGSGAQLSQIEMRTVADHLIDRYETADCWQKMPSADKLIDEIRQTGLSVGIISNFDPRLKFIVENVRLPRFDFILASYEVGAAKPDPRIFDLALTMSPGGGALAAGEALHVGNTPNLDYLGAKEAGWSSALITNGNRDWQTLDGQVRAAHVFETLTDFCQKLDSTKIDWDEGAHTE